MRWSIFWLLLLVAVSAWWLLGVEPPTETPAVGPLPAGAHVAVEAKSTGGENAQRVSVPMVAGLSSTELRGSVVDDRGIPVQGARVAIHAGSPPSLGLQEDVVSWTPPMAVHVLASSTTDDQGRFRLSTDSVAMDRVDIVASKAGWRRSGIRGHALRAHDSPVTLVLSRGLTISGRIITGAGDPVSGLMVFACSDPRTKARGIQTSMTKEWMAPAETGLSDGFTWSDDLSDGDGCFQLTGLARGELFVNAFSDRWMAIDMPAVSAGATDVTVTVVPVTRIRLAVESAGDQTLDSFSGLLQFSASIPPAFGHPYGFGGKRGVLEVWIGREGTSGAADRPDRLRLSLDAPGHYSYRQEHPVEDGVTDLRVRLEPEPSVPVPLLVFDRDGKRVSDLKVSRAAPRDAHFSPAVVTEVHGSPHVLLPPGLWQLEIRGRGQFPTAVPALTTVEVVAGRTAAVSANLSGGPTLTIDLRNVEGHEVIDSIIFRSSRGSIQVLRADAQSGLVVLSSVPEAIWEVSVQPKGRPVMSKSIEVSRHDTWLVFP
ncbi:MAG: carboxypeptidase-like regulatory domain-containing protein [Planctomycetota bacterium]